MCCTLRDSESESESDSTAYCGIVVPSFLFFQAFFVCSFPEVLSTQEFAGGIETTDSYRPQADHRRKNGYWTVQEKNTFNEYWTPRHRHTYTLYHGPFSVGLTSWRCHSVSIIEFQCRRFVPFSIRIYTTLTSFLIFFKAKRCKREKSTQWINMSSHQAIVLY